MKRHIPILFVVILILVGVIYILIYQKSAFQQGKEHTMGDMNSNSATQSHRSYEIEVISDTASVQPKQKTTISYIIKNDKGEVLKNYDIVHEKIMHFIAVRKDLAYFQHLHPEYNEATGEFTLAITFPEDGPYRIFPDFTPGVENPQKLPVTVYQDIEVGDSNNYAEQRVVPDTEQTKIYGEYSVTMTLPQAIRKQQEVTYTLNITNDGKPVTNLEKYLGALGHSVILKEDTLDFIHTHALGADSTNTGQEHGAQQHDGSQNTQGTGPEISFATNFPESGVYKIFTQFQHAGDVQTVDYIVKID